MIEAPLGGPIEKLPEKLTDASDLTPVNLAHKSKLIVDAFPDRLPNVKELEEMTRVFGYDLVAMAVLKILTSLSPNRYFLDRVDRAYRDVQQGLDFPVLRSEERPELCVVESVDPMSPKAQWGSHVETWRAWARKVGVTTDVIRTEKRNSLMANAELIRKEILLRSHDRRIIATVGQGSTEFRLLLEQLLKTAPHELVGIEAWINVAGDVRGASALSHPNLSRWDSAASELSYWWRGWPRTIGHQLEAKNPRLRLEPDLKNIPFTCVSMVGFPALVDVPAGLKGSFLKLSKYGPNDGVTTFNESALGVGYVVPVSGMSHGAEPERLGPWFKAVVRSLSNHSDFEVTPRPFRSIDQ